MLPRDIGLLCWAEPVTTRRSPLSGVTLDAVAASWLTVPTGVWVTLYDDAAPITAPLGEEARRRMGWLAEAQSTMLPWTGDLQFGDEWARAPAVRATLRVLMTTWLLMGQTITAARPERPAGSVARRIARRGHPTDPVTYAALRAIDRPPDEHGDPGSQTAREWRHRWVVSGHWRNQYYPSIDRNRPIWIAPHLKGPEGAPLLHAERVYALRR